MNDAILRQLTAYVDGELSSAECDAVNRLLRESDEARQVLRSLQRDAERLRRLEREPLPVDFSELVLHSLAAGARNPQRARRWAWAPTAAAAAILVGVALGTFAIIQQFNKSLGKNELAQGDKHNTPSLIETATTGRTRPADRPSPADALNELRGQLPTREQFAQMTDELRDALNSLVEGLAGMYGSGQELVAGLLDREAADQPSAGEAGIGNPTYLTSQMHPSKAFRTIQLSKLPLFLDLKELETTKLAARLREDSLHHVDLSCLESWKALERLQAACRVNGVRLVIDAEVTQRSNQKAPAAYMLYLENVSPDLVVKVMVALQAEEKRADQRRKGDTQFGSIMVLPLDDAGRKRLADALGVSSSSLLPAKAKKSGPAAGVDPTTPLAKETEKALDKLAAGQGPRAVAKEPTAVLLVASPSRPRVPVSKEVKQHLDSRSGVQPETVNVVFVLRPSRG